MGHVAFHRKEGMEKEKKRERERRDVKFEYERTAEPILWYRGALGFEVLAALDAWQTYILLMLTTTA